MAQFREEWTFKNDNEFVLRIYDGLVQSTTPLQTSRGRQAQLCERCTSLDFLDEDFIIQDKSSFKPNETPCDLCALLYKTREKKSLEAAAVTFRIAGSALVQDNSPHLRLTIRANKESYKSAQSIQIGIPELLKGGSQPQFELCRQWLQDCIANHETCKSKEDHYPAMKELPTRLINVGSEKEPRVFLYSPGKDEGLKYIALSHPWGDENKHNHYVTNTTNIQEHEKEICQTKLPDLFKDAIKLTRELRYQYLWIDSLCIIQGDEGDFEAEASRMELVYSNADCVIAATDAKGNSDKFLITRPTRDYVEIGKNEQSRFSVCEAIDDFQKHVLEGSLNKRGWVLQERALARRIIHFTEKQMYWECGEGIRCETLTKMINEQAAFLSDPNFPLRAMNSTKGTKILFYQQLYRQYSRLEFSRPTDRCLGVAGLEQRLIKHFKVDGGFGVFQAPPERKYDEGYFGRSLLWKRGEDVDNLTPIKYDESTLPKSVPSWSWMAYDGGIDYLDESMLPFNKVTWMTKELKSPWDVTHSSLSWHTNKRGSTELRGEARRFWESSMDGKEARLFYDRESEEPKDYWFSDIRCVVIGIFEDKDKVRKSCVLLVAPRENSAYYTRIGVGLIPTSSIHPNQERVRIC
ncbi:heterokaryon incompatibility protein-domain-containing protein [Camillea tinctor]|nr:heterokaryon incompatibility protein-domain-containing protein [Camillea tinctor]